MAQRRRPQGRGRDQPGDRQDAGASAACLERRSRRRARGRRRRASRVWKATSAYDRSKIMRKAADLVRERYDHISKVQTQEQGKVYVESRAEVLTCADIIDWYAEEGRRTYGRVIPGRAEGRAPARAAGAGRRGRRLHAVEFPDADADPQDRRRACRRLLAHHQGLGRNAGRLRRTGEMLRRRRPAGGRAQSGVRRAGQCVGAPDPVARSSRRFPSPARSPSASISPASPPRA